MPGCLPVGRGLGPGLLLKESSLDALASSGVESSSSSELSSISVPRCCSACSAFSTTWNLSASACCFRDKFRNAPYVIKAASTHIRASAASRDQFFGPSSSWCPWRCVSTAVRIPWIS